MASPNSKFFLPFLSTLIIASLFGGVLLRVFVESKNDAEGNIVLDVEAEKVIPPVYLSSFLESSQTNIDEDERLFLNFRKSYIEQEISFIEVNLREMKLYLYEDGRLTKEFPVLTKGREGSWWETPTGNYAVLSKVANHFSSIGKVWMPWSIQFYGNFFIHGWPYYSDGTPVATTYSGGCVRLSVEDAKEIFEFVEKSMPILMLETPDIIGKADEIIAKKASENLVPPLISAKTALITDLDSGQVLLDKNAGEPLPIASLIKLMTGVVASELIYLERSIRVLPSMLSGLFQESILSSNIFSPFLAGISFIAGKSYTAFDLLYPLLMQSSNEAASIIASFIGKDKFIVEMNRKAASLAMSETQFADSSGKDNRNISTAKDLAKLARYILEKRKFLFDISKGKNYLAFGPLNFGDLKNYNEFVDYENLIGVKNGETRAAGQTLLTVWNLRSGENSAEKRIAIIVLGSEDRKEDTTSLLGWLKNNFNLQ